MNHLYHQSTVLWEPRISTKSIFNGVRQTAVVSFVTVRSPAGKRLFKWFSWRSRRIFSSHCALVSYVFIIVQEVVVGSWCSHRQVLKWSWRLGVCSMWTGELSPELYLTSCSPLLHTPCQQVGPYLSPTELSHWAHTWPCHYLVPGFVSTLLSPFCVFPDFPFPHYLN